MIRNHCQIARNFVQGVCSGAIAEPATIRAACARSDSDWSSQEEPQYPYRFDPEAATRICRFIERLPHVEGVWAAKNERIRLEPWQIWIISELFGWKKKSTGFRRFRTGYVEVPRKNGKSLIGAAVALAMLLEDDEIGAQVYSVATSREQSKIIFDTAWKMVQKSGDLARAYGIKMLLHSISVPRTNGIFRALASEDRGSISLDGLGPHFVAVDELHAHSTSGTWDAMESGTGSRAQSMILALTTAGSDITGVCYRVRSYAEKVATGAVADDSFFGAIWAMDTDAPDDAWKDPAVWRMVNPNLGVSVFEDDLQRQFRKAQAEPAFESTFKTKRLCCWVHSDMHLFSVGDFIASADDTMTREDFRGQSCYVGIDLAPMHDFSVVVYLFPLEDDSYYVICDHYLPEDEVESNPQFVTWAAQGLIKTVPGSRMDYRKVIADVVAARDEWGLDIQQVAFDSWQANELATDLDDAHFDAISVPMRPSHLSEPTKKAEALISQHKLFARRAEIGPLAWCISNVTGHYDRNDNVLPVRPDDRRLKIDSAVAIILALSRAIIAARSVSVYDSAEPEPIMAGE